MDCTMMGTEVADVLLVVLAGTGVEEDLRDLRQRFFLVLAGSTRRSVLVDTRKFRGPRSLRSHVLFFRILPKLGRSMNVAIVEPDRDRNQLLFFQSAADRVDVRMKYFVDYDQARIWLERSRNGMAG